MPFRVLFTYCGWLVLSVAGGCNKTATPRAVLLHTWPPAAPLTSAAAAACTAVAAFASQAACTRTPQRLQVAMQSAS